MLAVDFSSIPSKAVLTKRSHLASQSQADWKGFSFQSTDNYQTPPSTGLFIDLYQAVPDPKPCAPQPTDSHMEFMKLTADLKNIWWIGCTLLKRVNNHSLTHPPPSTCICIPRDKPPQAGWLCGQCLPSQSEWQMFPCFFGQTFWKGSYCNKWAFSFNTSFISSCV